MDLPQINIEIVAVRTPDSGGRDVEMEDVQHGHAKGRRAPRNQEVFIPGDVVMDNAEGWMDGHGSYCSVLPDKRVEMLASVAGVRQIFTRVVVINPLKSRYAGEIGDIVVGRIVQVGRKSWTVDVGAQRHAVLSLGAINLPSGELRRKTEEDIGFMRGYLKEGDLISAEVQKQSGDGHLLLHTRSLRYGRLVHGMLLHVQPKLTKRGKGHFVSYETFGVHLIIGVNGAIWIAPTQRQLNIPLGLDAGEQLRQAAEEDYPEEQEMYVCMTAEEAGKFGAKADEQGYVVSATRSTATPIATLEVRKCMARIRNCIEILNREQVPIHRETIRILYDASRKYEPKELLQPAAAGEVFAAARQDLWGDSADGTVAD
ncbi:putative Exosome complex component RRP4 [Hypsibius exemplaris]|uniref:Exosome complex component RRP4 n=1 Tax=Hypsibius exemplaris TaxID=2072580 RepID=A0A1W0WPQ2_HYPEX|nr:putative Exosome complex component RRP4 [Hypsibius exemplaris]